MKSISTRIILLMFSGMFIMATILGSLSYYRSQSILKNEAEIKILEINEQLSRLLRSNLDRQIVLMETLAARRIITDDTPWKTKVDTMQEEAVRLGFQAFGFADQSGNSMRFNAEKSIANIADRVYFIKAISGTPAVSDVLINKVTGKPTVSVAVPVKRKGDIVGVLYGILDGLFLSDLVKDTHLGNTGYCYIMNREGTLIGHKNVNLVLKQFNPVTAVKDDPSLKNLADTVKIMLQGTSGTQTYTFNKKDVAVAYTPVAGTDGWKICVAIEVSEFLKDVNNLKYFMIITTVILLFAGTAMAYLTGKKIAEPIISASLHAGMMAELELGSNVPSSFIKRDDEIGNLGKALQTLTGILRETITEIRSSSQMVSSSAEEISTGNLNLSQRTAEQASAIEEIAATIEEANASIRQISDNAIEAKKLSDKSLELAEEGGKIVQDAVSSIIEINNSSTKIADIISMINEIAFQTNLLALNAAVEAARAGEQGRGFAVVAGEVRNLAQRAGEAAKEIGTLIANAVDKISTGTGLVNKSGESLKMIIDSIRRASVIVSEIAAGSEEQKRGMDQINIAIAEMDSMTQQNASLVEETAAASEEMSGHARNLNEMVEQFKLGQDNV